MNNIKISDAQALLADPKSAITWASLLMEQGRTGINALVEGISLAEKSPLVQLNEMRVHNSNGQTIKQSLRVRDEVAKIVAIGDLLEVDNIHWGDNDTVITRVKRDFINDFIEPFLEKVETIPKNSKGSPIIWDSLELLEVIPEDLLVAYLMEGVTVEYSEDEGDRWNSQEVYSTKVLFDANTSKCMRWIRMVDKEMATRIKEDLIVLAKKYYSSDSKSKWHPGAKIGEKSRVNARNSRSISTLTEALLVNASQIRSKYPKQEIVSWSDMLQIWAAGKTVLLDNQVDLYAE